MAAADTIKDLSINVKRCTECGARFGVEAAFCPFCGVPLSAATWDRALDPLVGKVVDNRYEVLEPLGEGGMGTVYKVRHVTLNRHFAMKALRRDLATDTALSQRFIQEARATAAIKNPAVVSINDFGVLEDGIPYFVMELLVGETLSVRMRARGPLPPREAIDIARRIADGLEASHAANVIHRDLKPENVFLVGPSELRVVDFGAAKIVGGSKLTRPGVVFGTPYYMSPEQAGGQPVDGRADVYSLGILLYEMLTGRVPFEADTYMGVLTKHMFAEPPRPSQAVSGVQLGALEDVVMRALEKDPTARYASMAELKKALDDAEKRRSSVAPGGRTHVLTPSVPIGTARMSTAERIGRSVEKQLEREERLKRKRFVTVVTAMVITLAIGIVVVAIAMRVGFDPTASNPPPPSATAPASSPASSPAASAARPAPPSATESAATVSQAASAPSSAASVASSSPVVPATAAAVAKAPVTPRWSPPPAPRPNPTAKAPETAPPVGTPAPTPTSRRPEDFPDPWRK